MQRRKEELVDGECHHIFSRSIAGYVVFCDPDDYGRMFDLLRLYRYANFEHKYSRFIELEPATQASI